jgi:hypothetical protein
MDSLIAHDLNESSLSLLAGSVLAGVVDWLAG